MPRKRSRLTRGIRTQDQRAAPSESSPAPTDSRNDAGAPRQRSKIRRYALPACAALLAVVIGISAAGVWIGERSGRTDGEYVRELDPTDGTDLTVFIDFNCPYCTKWGRTNLPDWRQKVFEPGHATYRQVNYPFINPNSSAAAEDAACAEELGLLREYTRAAMWLRDEQDDVDLSAARTDTGAAEEIRACTANGDGAKAVRADIELARHAGVTGTPAYYVDGRAVTSDEAWRAMDRAIGE